MIYVFLALLGVTNAFFWDLDISSSSCSFSQADASDGDVISVAWSSTDTETTTGWKLKTIHTNKRCANYHKYGHSSSNPAWTRVMKSDLNHQGCLELARQSNTNYISTDTKGGCFFTPNDGNPYKSYGHTTTSSYLEDCKLEGWTGWTVSQIVSDNTSTQRTTSGTAADDFSVSKQFGAQFSGITTVTTVVQKDNSRITYKETYQNGVGRVSSTTTDSSSTTVSGVPECDGKWAHPPVSVANAASCHGYDCTVQGQRCIEGSSGASSSDWCCGVVQGYTNLRWYTVSKDTPCDVPVDTDTPLRCVTTDGTEFTYGSTCE